LQKIASRFTDYRKSYFADLHSFVGMKYVVWSLLLLAGCQITPRYHQRGLHIDLHPAVGEMKSHKTVAKAEKVRQQASASPRMEASEFCSIESQSTKPESGVTSGKVYRTENELATEKSVPVFSTVFDSKPHLGVVNSILKPLKPTNKKAKYQGSLDKRTEKEDRLEKGATLCFALGLAVVLLSWWLASDLIFTAGFLVLLAGLMCTLTLGFNNVRYAFNGYMSIITILGALVVITRMGFLDELLAAFKP
jgi:hypothetical protein